MWPPAAIGGSTYEAPWSRYGTAASLPAAAPSSASTSPQAATALRLVAPSRTAQTAPAPAPPHPPPPAAAHPSPMLRARVPQYAPALRARLPAAAAPPVRLHPPPWSSQPTSSQRRREARVVARTAAKKSGKRGSLRRRSVRHPPPSSVRAAAPSAGHGIDAPSCHSTRWPRDAHGPARIEPQQVVCATIADISSEKKPALALEKRPRPQAVPCGTAAAAAAVAARSVDEVRKAHARHVKLGLDRSPRHARPLLAACALLGWPGGMELAAAIFESLDEPEAFDYNTLMRGHVSGDRDPAAALRLYVDMLEAGVEPDNYTFPFVLKASAQLAALQQGRQLQAHVVKLGFQHDEHVQNSLISLYGKCGEPAMARLAFDRTEAEERTAASWSALLAAYTRAGLWGECLESFGAMVREGWRPDESSMVSALSSCAHLGAYDTGRSIHCALLRNAARLNTIMLTSLVDMYAKCGCIEKAAAVFDAMEDKNAWAYSAMVSGLALHGGGRKALQVFDAMVREGHAPDAAVYVGVLNACSRAGLLEDGLRCFDRMRLEHKAAPNAQHYGCMVDLLARAGKLDDASALIGAMPTGPTDTAWRCLLNACRIHGDLGLAEHALRELRRLGSANAGDYVIVADMHARAKNWDAAAALRTEAVDEGLAQSPGFSAVEVRGEVHRFVSQDMSHPRRHDIYEMLHQMEWQLRFDGYKPDTSEVALDVGEEEKRRVVAAHSQKLAMAFGLLSTPEGAPVRIVTNLRMSKECHAYSALISEIFGREIVVRDRNRFHRFRRGACTCRDYW